ncbi:MAG: class I SAM-dependent methyltransferase [Bdellovibrionota bacterium]
MRYLQTDGRDIEDFIKHHSYPQDKLNVEDLKNKRVLDAGTGFGTLVEDLRRNGIEADGLDISLPASLKGKPHYIEADMIDTGIDPAIYDVIYANFTLFMYEGDNLTLQLAALRELSRILKNGGVIRIYPAFPSIAIVLKRIPELKIVEPLIVLQEGLFIELKKTD